MAKQFIIRGRVLGNLWNGDTGASTMQMISAPTRKKVVEMATKRLEMNKLTGTGDFNGEIGAITQIECIRTRTIDGRVFTNREFEPELVMLGELTDEQAQFLLDTNDF